MVSATGVDATASSNLTVTVAVGSPAASRRLRATDGGGGWISTWIARAYPARGEASAGSPAE